MPKAALYVRGVKFELIETEIDALLGEVDKGMFDAELSRAGVARPSGAVLRGTITLSQGQGLSPTEWAKLIVDFAPLVAGIGQSIWDIIIVPKLKRRFRSDQISEHNPQSKRDKDA